MRWYGGFSGRITTLLSNAGEQIYPAEEQDRCKTTIVGNLAFSLGRLDADMNDVIDYIPCELYTGLVSSMVERKAASDLPGRTGSELVQIHSIAFFRLLRHRPIF